MATEQNVLPAISQIPKAVPPIDSPDFAETIDHTLLKIEATRANIDSLCNDARVAGFASVCVRPNFTSQAVANTRGSPVKVCAVVGFPEGTHDLAVKMADARHAIVSGAHELDIVLNRTYLLASPLPRYGAIYNELASLRALAPRPTVLKLILETSQLNERQIIAACVLAGAANFDFVKTSTGYVGHGARLSDVRLMSACCEVLGEAAVGGWAGTGLAGEYITDVDERGLGVDDLDGEEGKRYSGSSGRRGHSRNVSASSSTSEKFSGWRSMRKKNKMQVKASGGIRTLDDAVAMLQAGATRLGTSGGVWILREAREKVEWGLRKQRHREKEMMRLRGKSLNSGPGRHSGGTHIIDFEDPSRTAFPPRKSSLTPSATGSEKSIKAPFVSVIDTGVRNMDLSPIEERKSSGFPSKSKSHHQHSRSAHQGSDGMIQFAISARTTRVASAGLGLLVSSTTAPHLNGQASHVKGHSRSASNPHAALTGRKGSLAAATTVTIAGVSDIDGFGILNGNGVYLGRKETEDRPGLATRLFSDY